MKSTLIQLESRGYLTDEAFEKYKHCDNIDKLIHSESAVERTAGVRLISLKHDIRNIESLLSLLKIEKRLYTKLEICECITKYGSDAGVEQYAFKLLEEMERELENDIDRAIIEKIEKD